jgi:two-component system sensor histidine kinase UhpB
MPRGKDRLSLRFRLNLMIALAMLLIIGVGFLFTVNDARRSVEDEIRSTVSLALQLVEAGFAESRSNDESLSRWMSQLGRLDQTRHLRISVTGVRPESIELTAPKAAPETLAPAWFNWIVAPEPIVVEHHLGNGGGRHYTIRIEADSGDEIAEAWLETRGFLLLILALACAIYALVHVTVGRAFRSVGTILEGLEYIEKGEFGKRLPGFELPEFERISSAFNHMASKLEKSRQENRALIRRSMLIQEEERRYLARELHDELGQSLTAIKVMAAALRSPDNAKLDTANHIMSLCDRLFSVVRGMMRRLRPSMLDELGLSASLEDLVDHWRSSHPELGIELNCDPAVDDRSVDARIDLFRIVQECLTNVVKHAMARHVVIRLQVEESRDGPWIALLFKDDGRGFDAGQPSGGFGLYGIRERIAGLGGRLTITTRPGQGVAIEARVPVPAGDKQI